MASSSSSGKSDREASAVGENIQDFVDSTGGFVTDALCEALVNDLLPKNLLGQVVGVVRPEREDRADRKHASSRKRSDLLSEDAVRQRVISLFPGAAASGKLRQHVLSLLREEGMVDSNTLYATCQCPEDSHYIFKDCGVAGERFTLGGLGGLPALGRTGVELVLKARPAGGQSFPQLQKFRFCSVTVSTCDAVRCCAMLCDAVRCCAVLCGAVRCCAMLCDAVRCCAMLCDAVRCSAMLCDAVRCCEMLT